MWYLECVIYIMSILAVAVSLLPWSILTKSQVLLPNCHLPDGFQLVLWGSACGVTWDQYQDIPQMGSYFAFVNVVTVVRIYAVFIGLAAVFLAVFVMSAGIYVDVVLFTTLLISVLSIISLAEYASDMNASMTIPPDEIFIQGPGYITLMAVTAMAFAVFVLVFYLKMYKYETYIAPTRDYVILFPYFISIFAVYASFGSVALFRGCSDYVSPIYLTECGTSLNPVYPILTILTLFFSMVMICTDKFASYTTVLVILLSITTVIIFYTEADPFGYTGVSVFSMMMCGVFAIGYWLVYIATFNNVQL